LPPGCNPTTAQISAALGTASATDLCGTPTLVPSDGAVISTGCARSQTRTFTATDACGNIATDTRTVSWTSDLTAPVITITQTPLPPDVIQLLHRSVQLLVLHLQRISVVLQLLFQVMVQLSLPDAQDLKQEHLLLPMLVVI
jgi:hypothetical protein